ncbi:hypothetical protein FOZ62_006594 [Perkinsus olseni]|uniref:Uncharacterized protein n=1 Tax=Perkinsus olseni TaxID=32597 RepID=A0A7J6PWW7_PEROL|nr:hypothetical protein FOZ62_006594 [Perkinsus olseni]
MSLESVAAKVQAANWNDPPSAGVSKCTLESVDATIEGMDGQKLAANIRSTAMGLYVRALGRDIKVNQKVGNKVIDGLREELLVPEVDFNKVKGPQVYNSQGLILDTLPVISWDLFNEFESRVMDLPLLNTFHIVPDIWYKMEPRLRLFICNNSTRFDELIDVVDVKCLHDEGIDYSPRLANLGQFIRFMVVRTFLDLTNQWDSESTYPFLVLSRMAYDTKAVVQKVKPITLSLFFTIKRVYAMYNTIFWRTQWNYYTHRNEYGIVQKLEKGFDHQSFQVFKKYEPYLQFFLVDGVATEGMLEAIPHIEKAYCYTKGSYGKDGWKSWGKDDGTWKSPDAYVGKNEGGSEHKDTWFFF